jgi:hypothetical protein
VAGAAVSDASLIVTSEYNATIQTWETTYVGWNLSSQPVAGTTLIISRLMWGMWVTIWEDCPSSSSG